MEKQGKIFVSQFQNSVDSKMINTLIENYNEKSKIKIDWESQLGLEIHYQMCSLADNGFFKGFTEGEVGSFLTRLVFIGSAGFSTAITNINNSIKLK